MEASIKEFQREQGFTSNTTVDEIINVGLNAEARGEYKLALKLFLHLLAINEPPPTSGITRKELTFAQELKIIRLVSACYRYLGDYKSALKIAKKYLAFAEHMRDSEEYPSKSDYPDLPSEQFQLMRSIIKARSYVYALEEAIAVYIGLKTYNKAVKLIKEGLKMLDEIHLDNCQEYGSLLLLLGISDSRQEKYKEGLINFNKAKMILSEYKHGHEYPILLNEIAVCHEKLNQFNEVLALYKEAVDNHRNLHGSEHPELAVPLSNLALFYCGLKQYERAVPLYEEAINICRKEFGDKHERTMTIIRGLDFCNKQIENPHRELISLDHIFRMCNTCDKISEDVQICPACFKAWYCDAECQLKDWPNHKPSCHVCMKCDALIDRDSKILRCSKCKKAKYCNAECQKADWKVHKPFCIPTEK